MGGEPIMVALDETESGWRLDLEKLFDACDERTRAICINSPSNPTGWMMPAEQQREVLEFCRKRGLWLIADEVYARLVYDRNHAPSFLEQCTPDDLVMSVNSFSKSWSMTGWRLGWVTAPPAMGTILAKLNEFNVASPASFAQYAGIAAVEQGEPLIEATVERYRIARDIIHQRLGALPRVHMARPEAAFYAYFSVEGVTDSMAFAKQALAETKVGLAPGVAFGPYKRDHLRICYAKSAELLTEALDRLEPLLR
jgi:aspartate/methionine/tyrosine aminotransferase